MRKRRVFAWAAMLIGIVVGVVALEALATAWLALEEGRYVSAREMFERAPNAFIQRATKDTGCTYVDSYLPHPYVAFVHHGDKPCGNPSTNNIGLYATDFPTARRTDRYVVLLTGGSVAAGIGQASDTAPRFLEEVLARRYASPNGQPWLVLNGGEGGWKQPQQLFLFGLYATRVDAVVTLDGFNEAQYFGPRQQLGFEVPGPSFTAVNPLFRGRFGDAAKGWLVARVAQAIAASPLLSRSHAAYLVHRALIDEARRWDIAQHSRKTRMDTIFGLPDGTIGNPEKIFAVQLERYRDYMIEMAAVADIHDVKSAFFLQPVPIWGKTLTELEKKRMGDVSYIARYRDMVDGLMTLKARGLAMYDLGDVFQKETGTIYIDAVHSAFENGTNRGYELIAERMAGDLAQAWGLKRLP